MKATTVGVYLTIKNVCGPLWRPNLSIISDTWKPKPAYNMAAIWKVNDLVGAYGAQCEGAYQGQ